MDDYVDRPNGKFWANSLEWRNDPRNPFIEKEWGREFWGKLGKQNLYSFTGWTRKASNVGEENEKKD